MDFKIVVACAALCLSTNASAVSFAEVRITHITTGFYRSDVNGVPLEDETITSSTDVDLVIVSSLAGPAPNDQWEFRGFGSEMAPVRGITYFNEYGYTLTASDDGLMGIGPFTADPTPLPGASCGRTPSDHEFACAGFQLGSAGRPSGAPGTFVGGDIVVLKTVADDKPDYLTLSGVARGSVRDGGFGAAPAGVDYAWTFANGNPVSPVPEPETYALLPAGLAVLGASTRARRKRGWLSFA